MFLGWGLLRGGIGLGCRVCKLRAIGIVKEMPVTVVCHIRSPIEQVCFGVGIGIGWDNS